MPEIFWTPEKMREAAERWVALYGRPPRPIDFNPTDAKRFGDPQAAIRFRAGTYPSVKTVLGEYGDFASALEAWGMIEPGGAPLPRQLTEELGDIEKIGLRAGPELVVTRIRSWGRAKREGTPADEAAELRLLAAAALGHALQLESRG